MQPARSFLASSRIISLMTLLSRVSGLVRDVIIAAWLGNGWINDRLTYAFAIPHLFRRLFGEGALSAAFVPVVNQWLHREGKSAAERVFSAVASLLVVVLAGLTVTLLGLIGLIYLLGQHSVGRHLTLGLTAVMVPYVFFVCLTALFAAMLNCLHKFALAAFVPVVLNLFQIAAVLIAQCWVSRLTDRVELQVYTVGIAVLLAGVSQLLLLLGALRRVSINWRWCWRVRWQPVRRIAVMMAPMILGLGAFQLAAWLDSQIIVMLSSRPGQYFSLFGMQINYPLEDGSLSALNYARRLYHLPLGVLAIALATAAFPAFSRYAAADDRAGLGRAVNQALRIAIFEGLASGAALIVIAPLVVRALFQHGNFDQHDAQQTAYVLRFYCIGLWAYCVQPIILRAFYSMQDPITPMRVTCVTLAVGFTLSLTLLWVPTLQVAAFGLSTSIMATLNVLILGRILSSRLGGISFGQLFGSAWRAAGASAVMCVACYLSMYWLADSLNKYLLLLVVVAVGVLTLLAGSKLLGCTEPAELLAGTGKTRR